MIAVSGDNVLSSFDPESTLGERIHNARQEAGLTLNLASHLAGVKASTLRDWERDRSEPRVNKLVALAGIFGVSPTHLLAEEGNSNNPTIVTKGRHEKVMALLKAEIADIEQQQIALTQRLGEVSKLLKKVKWIQLVKPIWVRHEIVWAQIGLEAAPHHPRKLTCRSMSEVDVWTSDMTGRMVLVERRSSLSMNPQHIGLQSDCETDVPVDSDKCCPKMAVSLGFGWLLVLGWGTPPLHQNHSPHHIMC